MQPMPNPIRTACVTLFTSLQSLILAHAFTLRLVVRWQLLTGADTQHNASGECTNIVGQALTGIPRYVILLSRRRDGRSGGGVLGL